MIITILGSRKLTDVDARFLFGLTSLLVDKNVIRSTLANTDASDAITTALEKYILGHLKYDIELYPISSDLGTYTLRDLIVSKHTNWNIEPNKTILGDYTTNSLFNNNKVGATINAIKGPHLDTPSEVVVYYSDYSDRDDYNTAKMAADEAGSDFYDISKPSELASLFKRLDRRDYVLYNQRH